MSISPLEMFWIRQVEHDLANGEVRHVDGEAGLDLANGENEPLS